jgi:DNA invertase Pin-like site-specific DNA recombinase
MIDDIEHGLIGRVCVRDVSRFGRNQSLVGYYIDLLFPRYDVEFVSISEPDGDYIPLKNFINELYAKETSVKIRAVKQHKGNAGERLAPNPPMGYKKGVDKDGKENWIVDEISAPVVRKIFDLYVNERYSLTEIKEYLKTEKILIPRAYEGKREVAKSQIYNWNVCTLVGILTNQVYCGDTVNFKTERISYKNKKEIKNNPADYKIFTDTHEAIVSRDIFEKAQQNYAKRRRPHKKDTTSPFNGLVFCADCGSQHHVQKRGLPEPRFTCYNYRKNNCKVCSAHPVVERFLREKVVDKLREFYHYFSTDEENFRAKIEEEVTRKNRNEQRSLNRRLKIIEEQKNNADTALKNLYIEKMNGQIDEEVFTNLSQQFNTDSITFNAEKFAILKKLNNVKSDYKAINAFYKILSECENISEERLTEKFLNSVIEKILVHETKRYSKFPPRLDIYFIGIGYINFA